MELVVSLAGIEYLEAAIEAGADAVTIGYRSIEDGFAKAVKQAITCVHQAEKKVYVAFDFFAHNEDIEQLKLLLGAEHDTLMDLDGIVVYDPGVFELVKRYLPEVPIHIGAPMNVTNDSVCATWKTLGASRVVLAHVLSADAIEQIGKKTKDIQLEAFVYGIPCISYSGRRLLDGFLEECHVSKEDTKYLVMEEQRQDEYYTVSQDERGTYIFDAKERNYLEDISRFVNAGVQCFCVEATAYTKEQMIAAVKVCRKQLDTNL